MIGVISFVAHIMMKYRTLLKPNCNCVNVIVAVKLETELKTMS